MLVLTRPVDQGDKSVIMIGDSIEVTVVEVRGDQVRLGIKAPRDMAVDRSEVWEDKRAEGAKRAAQGEGFTNE